jgi:membrane fusion protein (multidrug efflux system)
MADTEPNQPPQQNAPPQNTQPEKKEEAPQPKKSLGRRLREHPIKFVVFLVVVAVAAIAGMRMWAYLDSYESTDDAQIDGDVYPVTTRVAGTLKGVYVEDNQAVKAGQVLADLDPRDYNVALEQAQANLKESQSQVAVQQPNVPLINVTTESTISTSGSDLETAQAQVAQVQQQRASALADIASAEADSVKAQADLARYSQLVARDEISKQQYDQAVATAKAAAADVEARKATAEAAARNIEVAQSRVQQARTRRSEAERSAPQQVAIQRAMVASKQATAEVQKTQVDQALLNLSYVKILAPIDGIVGRKSVAPGQQVSPGQQIMLDIPLNRLWVTANFKETQLKKMHPGQRATLHVDAYDKDLEGSLQEFAGASGARFSLLPPENATGNYVKVVQRVPVRIGIKPGQDPNHLLRPGMSVDPKVWLDK